jgi:hypothetical protein
MTALADNVNPAIVITLYSKEGKPIKMTMGTGKPSSTVLDGRTISFVCTDASFGRLLIQEHRMHVIVVYGRSLTGCARLFWSRRRELCNHNILSQRRHEGYGPQTRRVLAARCHVSACALVGELRVIGPLESSFNVVVVGPTRLGAWNRRNCHLPRCRPNRRLEPLHCGCWLARLERRVRPVRAQRNVRVGR